MIGVAQRNAADAEFLGQFDGAIHRQLGIDVAQAQIAVPALEGAHRVDLGRFGLKVDIALVDVFDDSREAIDAVRINAVTAGLGHQLRRKVGGGFVATFLDQNALELRFEFFKRDTWHVLFL